MESKHTQALRKIMDAEIVLFFIGYIIFSTAKNDLIPRELLPFSGIPVLINFWLLTKHFNLMKQIVSEDHLNKSSVQRRFYLNAFMDGLLFILILWEIFG